MAPKKNAPPLSKREHNAALKREAILEAALSEFMDHGFEAARMDAIARKAGVGKGTLYLYCKDKESLFEEAILAVVTPFKNRIMEQAGQGDAGKAASLASIAGFMPELLSESGKATAISLLIREGIRFPHLVQFYYREVIKPALTLIGKAMNSPEGHTALRDKRMAKYPHMLFMPGIFWVLWQNIFGRQETLDLQELMDIHLANSLVQEKKEP